AFVYTFSPLDSGLKFTSPLEVLIQRVWSSPSRMEYNILLGKPFFTVYLIKPSVSGSYLLSPLSVVIQIRFLLSSYIPFIVLLLMLLGSESLYVYVFSVFVEGE